ncbi:MAG: TIGR03545 family protein [Candidatus Marinimicrobia bacterium]|nr:TIGR03545 family protein [Candidatus Neomarinimicrobiota bacterium]MBT3632827.1 TIGR03545 family protein [Candidatus Neomarinimicrobiota bacterium]MBT3681937.1 TIGR03545 family protein [Candidatus Neomarinimicrobiota bacterium]MBT3759034.1 TIGR03545 family protein [Candidatus Neomarinimicrobiota bacterium]MBT3895067.1 TIGR03545 family protein [Candidatus Neomarinimicrobiota bacterium]
MFRRNGIILLLTVVAFLLILPTLFLDSIIENYLEDYGSEQAGALVEIEGLTISFIHSKIEWDQLIVADSENPMLNLFETGFTVMDIDIPLLFSRKLLVPNIEILDLQFQTGREKSGAIKKKTKKKTEKPVHSPDAENPEDNQKNSEIQVNFENVNVDSLIDKMEMKAPAKIDSLKSVYANASEQWHKELDQLPDDQQLDLLEDRINNIDYKQIKSADDLKKILSEVSDIKKEIRGIIDSNKEIKDMVSHQTKDFKRHPDLVKVWVENDYDSASEHLSSGGFSTENLARMIFGDEIISQIEEYQSYLSKGRKYYTKFNSNEKSEDGQRGDGEDIYFEDMQYYPVAWIKNVQLSSSSKAKKSYIIGSVKDISTHQQITNLPIVIDVLGEAEGLGSYKGNGEIYYAGSDPREDLEVSISNIPLKGYEFKGLPFPLENGTGEIQSSLHFLGDNLLGSVHFNANQLEFNLDAENKKQSSMIIREIAQSIDNIDMQAEIEKSAGSFKTHISSNLDDIFKSRIDDSIKANKSGTNTQIAKRKADDTQKYQDEITSEVSQLEKQALDKLGISEAEYKDKLKQLDKLKKEAEKSITNKQKKDLEKKLKNIFR